MKVLLDECTPRLVQRQLPELEIATVQELGWTGIKNGALLRLAENEFDVFVTSDKNLRYQQNLSGKSLAIIELPSNQVPVVALLVSKLRETLEVIKAGEFVSIPLPE
ncbi:MAG TPA: DUF5615 family PIN-like protein [Pyrinomonadaceae bacterium]|nr:DUF5615 family PIN-like protein [Pyrinomonadaceae bacterium]